MIGVGKATLVLFGARVMSHLRRVSCTTVCGLQYDADDYPLIWEAEFGDVLTCDECERIALEENRD